MPDPWLRLLAFPNGIAMISLGYSLWRIVGAERTETTETTDTTQVNETVTLPPAAAVPRVAAGGPE